MVDFERYPSWNPFIKSIKGDLKLGEKIVANMDGMTFKPTITVLEKGKRLTWLGHLLFKGLFDGAHSFRLEKIESGGTMFYHEEEFSGLLVGLFRKKLLSDTRNGFIGMNKKLKEIAES